MKRIFLALGILATFSSCNSFQQIGKLNMISNRNVDPNLKYQLISTYSGGSNRELKKSRSTSIEDAIDRTVRKVPGGEFLMNAKVYLINGKYIAVEGDVWGVNENIAYRGFRLGDKVTWKVVGGFKSGTIKALKDDKTCLIEAESGEMVEKKYDDISKSE